MSGPVTAPGGLKAAPPGAVTTLPLIIDETLVDAPADRTDVSQQTPSITDSRMTRPYTLQIPKASMASLRMFTDNTQYEGLLVLTHKIPCRIHPPYNRGVKLKSLGATSAVRLPSV